MIEIHCNTDCLTLSYIDGETEKDSVMREFGWLLNPIIQSVGSYETAIQKLNWKVVKKQTK